MPERRATAALGGRRRKAREESVHLCGGPGDDLAVLDLRRHPFAASALYRGESGEPHRCVNSSSVAGGALLAMSVDAATGGFLWQDRTVGSPATDEGTAVELANGRAFVSGWRVFPGRTTAGFKETFFVRSYDADSGVLRWENTHQVDELGSFLWHALDLDVARGRLFAVGQDVAHGTWLVRALELNSGDVIWQREFEPDVIGADYSWTQAAAVGGGRLFVAGSVFNAMGNSDALVRALDAR